MSEPQMQLKRVKVELHLADAVTRQTFTTTEAAHLCGVDPRSFTRWARTHGITPVRRMRIGRSYVTLWSLTSLLATTKVAA